MSRLVLWALIALIHITSSYAQKYNKPDEITRYRSVFRKAFAYGDKTTAINALYHLEELLPESGYKDTLALLYFDQNAFWISRTLAIEILSKKPNNLMMLEILAASEEFLNRTKEALDSYEKLYIATGSIYFQYKIATMQYALQRYAECNETISSILKNPEAEKEKVYIASESGNSMPVLIAAAAHNVRGMIALLSGKNTEAADSFRKALSFEPEFELAKNNLQQTQELK